MVTRHVNVHRCAHIIKCERSYYSMVLYSITKYIYFQSEILYVSASRHLQGSYTSLYDWLSEITKESLFENNIWN